MKKRSQIFAAFLIVGGICFTATSSYADSIKKDQDFFDAVKEYIDIHYALPVSDEKLYDAAVKGLFDALDPYSEYLTKEEYDELKETTSGKYTGIGTVIGQIDSGFQILSVFKDSPAEKAGLLAGDLIIAVDGKSVESDRTLQSLVNRIKGIDGTTVKLSISRNQERKEFTVTRKKITLFATEHKQLEADIGYLKIAEFQEKTYQEVQKAIRDLKKKGCRKLVLDLRGNPGGLLSEVVQIADSFVPKGKLLEVHYKNALPEIYYSAGELQFQKVAVLIDENTASAAEILSGAMKDAKSGVLFGQKTYGKGVVQTIYELRNGEAIKLTVAKYVLPSGLDVNGKGIQPDVVVKKGGDREDRPLQKAVQFLKKK